MREVGSVEDDVLIGVDQQLFLASGHHRVMEYITGQRAVLPEVVTSFRANLLERSRLAAQAGAQYLHVVFPDKQSVLTSKFPLDAPICLGEYHLTCSPDISSCLFYPLELLRAEQDSVFLRTDTHLSDRGTILVTTALVEALTGEDQGARRKALLDTITLVRPHVGDLGNKLRPNESSVEEFAEVERPGVWLHNDLTGGNNGTVDIYVNNQSVYPQRVLWFGDSFGREAVRFLTHFFREIVFLRTPFFHAELFSQIAPDIVISENVERYLASCELDETRPNFQLYPFLSQLDYKPSKAFAEAFSAVLAFPRSPYKAWLKRLGL